MTAEAVVIVSDLHINSKVGLSSPLVRQDDGDDYKASKGQRWLWRCWLEFAEWVQEETAGCGVRTLVLNGDIVDKDAKYRSTQIISRNPATIVRMAADVLEPLLDIVDVVYVVRGTEAHTGKSANLEEMVARDIGAVGDPERGTSSWWHIRRTCAGVRFDIAHHASMGGLPWTEKQAANKLAEITWHRYLEAGMALPDVVVRGHNHRYADSGGNYPFYAVMLPGWCLLSSYLYRMGKENDVPKVGGMVFRCEGSEYVPRYRDWKVETGRELWKTKF